jgi:hypothetical protein
MMVARSASRCAIIRSAGGSGPRRGLYRARGANGRGADKEVGRIVADMEAFGYLDGRDEDVGSLLDEELCRSEAYSYRTISNDRRLLVICLQSLLLPYVLLAQYDQVQDVYQHGLVVLVQGGRSELDQALLRTRL